MKSIFLILSSSLFLSFPLLAVFETPEEAIEMLVNSNYHLENGLKCAKLFEVDPTLFEEIKTEVLQLIEINHPSDVTNTTHVTNWTKPWGKAYQFSLLNASGNYQDFSVDHNNSVRNKKFHESLLYPHLAQFISLFPHSTNFRINIMGPESGLSQHRENICMFHPVTQESMIRVRFHLPIQTNPSTLMFLHEDLYQFDEGYIYFFNNGMNHCAENNDPHQSRIHLVWDMLLTSQTYEDLFKRSPNRYNELYPLEDVSIPIIGNRKEDPNYPSIDRMPIEMARKTTLTSLP